MNPHLKNSIIALVAAAIIAVIFDYLFIWKDIGVSVPIFIAVLAVIFVFFSVRFKLYSRTAILLALPVIFFSFMLMFRTNEFLNFLNVVSILGLILLIARVITKDTIINFGIIDYLATVFAWPFKMLRSAFLALSFVSRNSNGMSSGNWKPIVTGFLVAIPVLVFFGALFVSADLAFKSFVDNALNFNIDPIIVQHALLIAVIFVVALGLLAFTFSIPEKYMSMYSLNLQPENDKPVVAVQERKTEVGVFLSSIALLFLLFIGFQISYLFGGADNIINAGFTYAEYARRGFWELLVVSITTLIILLLIDTLTKKSIDRKWFMIPSLIIVAEIMVIIASAFKRLMLYESAYGMTSLRLFVAAFIILVAVIFVILAVKLILKKQHSFFAFGGLISIIAFVVCFNLINPDKFVTQQNIARFNETQKIDPYYLADLSSDAVPTFLTVYDRLNPEDKNYVMNKLIEKKYKWEMFNQDWQAYNVSRVKAIESINEKF